MNKTGENERRESFKGVIYAIILILIVGVSDAFLFYREGITTGTIANLIGSLLVLALALYILIRHYRRYTIPSRTGEEPQSRLDDEKKKTYSRPRGKDMFEICDSYRIRNRNNMLIAIAIMAILLPVIMIIGAQQNDINMPVWTAVLLGLAILAVSVIIAGKTDMKYKSVLELKFEIKKKGYDPMRVNNDFMMASYHDLFRGLLAIGQSYYVIHCQTLCHVDEINNIKNVEAYTQYLKDKNGKETDLIRHFVRISMNDGSYLTLVVANRHSAALIIYDFNKFGLVAKDNTCDKPKK